MDNDSGLSFWRMACAYASGGLALAALAAFAVGIFLALESADQTIRIWSAGQ